jgi:diadenosine tetraphosphate (Ap4A) HIT family hydrolase
MPMLIPRAEALDRIRGEGGSPACLMCAIAERAVGDVQVVFEDAEMLVFLPRYVRCWGHVCIMPRLHVTSFGEVPKALWARTSALGHKTSRVVESLQRPRRCYLASTGSSAGELTQSSMHLHLHVIPVHDVEDRPASVFSWQEGVYVAEASEWNELRDSYVRAWALDDARHGPE